MKNYERNAKIIHEICTQEALEQYFKNPNDPEHIVNVVLERVAKTLHDNPTLSFGSYDELDIYQFCWQWSMETLQAGKYNCQTSLFGYLHRVCVNKVFKLKRDKQWRSDISYQKACQKCKNRNICDRKIRYTDLDIINTANEQNLPLCKIKIASLKRNSAKYALSIQMDYDITEPECNKKVETEVEINDITEFFGEQIPEKYKDIFFRLLNGQTTGIPKNTITAARRWCWRIMRRLDKEQIEYYEKIYYNSYQKDLMKKMRKQGKDYTNADCQRIQRQNRKINGNVQEINVTDEDIKAVYVAGMSVQDTCREAGLAPGGSNYRRVRKVMEKIYD